MANEKETISKNDDDDKLLEKENDLDSQNTTKDLNNEDDVLTDEFIDDNKITNDEFVEPEKSRETILEEEVIQLKDEKLRILAEMENLRKRSDRDKVDSIRYGSMNLARDILSPEDNLTRALEAIPTEEKNSETIKNLIDGLKMVQKEFSTILEKYGVKKIDALNKKFDHNFHQAMLEVEGDDIDSGVVVQEMQSGYTMHDRLLRPSMVGVSKKTDKQTDNDEKKEKKD